MFAGAEGSQDNCLQYEGGSKLCARVLPLLQLFTNRANSRSRWDADFAYKRTEHIPAAVQAGSSVKAPTPERKVLADVQTFQEVEAFAARLARVVRLALLRLLLCHTGNRIV